MKLKGLLVLGYFLASFMTGLSQTKDIAEIKRKADAGDAKALYELAMYNLNYQKTSVEEVTKLLLKSAEQGYEMAQVTIGDYYEIVLKDYPKAMYWFEKAAEQGNGEALFYIGGLYMNGFGVTEDTKKAFEYWLKAAKYGHAGAMGQVGTVYEYGFDTVDIDVYKAFKYYKKGAELGNENAQFHVGKCYKYGIGVKKDIEEAKRWFKLSAAKGDERAIEELKNM